MNGLRCFTLLCFMHWALLPTMAVAQEAQAEALVKPTVAVMELAPTNDLSQTDAVTMTNRLYSEMIKTDAYILVERKEIDEILKEHALAQAGCLDEDCIIEVGNLLSAQYLIVGEVGKLGETYTLDLRLVNTETGQAEKTFAENLQGRIDGLLGLLPEAAHTLAGIPYKGPGGIGKILGVLGGVVVAGGGVAIYFLTRGGGTTTTPTLGKPPGPPPTP